MTFREWLRFVGWVAAAWVVWATVRIALHVAGVNIPAVWAVVGAGLAAGIAAGLWVHRQRKERG